MPKTFHDMVVAFQERFGHIYEGHPRFLPDDLNKARTDHLWEELAEYTQAETLEDKFDALIDLCYVAFGTAYWHGFDFNEGFRRVHEANMLKERGVTKRGHGYDVMKPAGWKPADLTKLTAPRGVILIEGPDSAGKTVLSDAFKQRYDATIIHSTYYEGIDTEKHMMGNIKSIGKYYNDKLVILDRSWPSEEVYADVHRGGHDPEITERLKTELDTFQPLTIFCMPETVESGEARFNEMVGSRSELYVDKYIELVNRYWTLIGSYTGPAEVYRIEVEGKDVLRFVRKIVRAL